MSLDTNRFSRTTIRSDRRTTSQLLTAAALDTDQVSIFKDSIGAGQAEVAVFVVKGREHIDYLRAVCVRQGLLTQGKPVVA